MTYVITSVCMTERAADCVEVCPVDCIDIGVDQFLINPNTCIGCGACVSVCPVEAIYFEEDVPEEEQFSILKAREYFVSL